MNTQLISNVIRLEKTAQARSADKSDMLPLIALSHEELRQLLTTQLQTSLDITTILTLFFQSSQRLVKYSSLSFQHAAQAIKVELGSAEEHSVNYNLNYYGDFLGNIVFTRANRFSEQELGNL